MTKEPISRAFKQDFPEFVERAKALGVSISLRPGRRSGPRVYWLDGYLQLTGYDWRKDGAPFTHEDAVRNIDKALTDIEEDRREVAGMTLDERFARVVAKFREMRPRHGMIGEVRFPCGDGGHCYFGATYDGGVRLDGVDVASADARWRNKDAAEQMAAFCDQLEQDYARRKRSNAA